MRWALTAASCLYGPGRVWSLRAAHATAASARRCHWGKPGRGRREGEDQLPGGSL